LEDKGREDAAGRDTRHDHELVIERVCAIDVAKASGKVCVRLPHPSRGGRRFSRVWDVEATTGAVTELADHLVGVGIEKVTVESTSDYVRHEGA
jgi:transposase